MHVTFIDIVEGKPVQTADHIVDLESELGKFVATHGWPDVIQLGPEHFYSFEDNYGLKEGTYRRTSCIFLPGVLSPSETQHEPKI